MSLHAGNDASAYRAAIVYSLISTCKNAGIEPRTWMEDVLTKIPYYLRDGKDLSELLPRHWAKLGNNRTDSDTNRTKSQYALHRRLTVYVFYRVVQAVGIRAGGIVLLGHRVLRRPAGCERVVEAGSGIAPPPRTTHRTDSSGSPAPPSHPRQRRPCCFQDDLARKALG